jgi:hypothetical protein
VSRIDNNGEFYGNEFKELYKKCIIARKNTTPYTPKQNGVTKIMSMTLMEKQRTMLSGVGLL